MLAQHHLVGWFGTLDWVWTGAGSGWWLPGAMMIVVTWRRGSKGRLQRCCRVVLADVVMWVTVQWGGNMGANLIWNSSIVDLLGLGACTEVNTGGGMAWSWIWLWCREFGCCFWQFPCEECLWVIGWWNNGDGLVCFIRTVVADNKINWKPFYLFFVTFLPVV